MFRLDLVGVLLLSCTQILTEQNIHSLNRQHGHHQSHHLKNEQYHSDDQNQNWDYENKIKEIRVKQGRLRGKVIQPNTNPRLQLVDMFLGVPYAEPPVGPFRFSPPRSPRSWRNVRDAQKFAPVCPQLLPDLRLEVKPVRHEYLEQLLPFLKNQSEDCLYLNIYAPHQPDGQTNNHKLPVMVFIHGESYEWNSGNPYDGTVLAAYGNIVFVTINFRLGILGFLRPGINDDTASNFGLLDQTAALLWLRENIAKFGGDPDSVTLLGHGTGAILANLLVLSPVANNRDLFKRAILMSGSALSADAIGKGPLQITKQVAFALNCPTKSDNQLALCLRNRDVESLLNVKIDKPKYVPAYAPLIDKAVIPRTPLSLMENAQLFGSFDLMYGVTESEKFHVLTPVAVLHGMVDDQRDEVLRDHAKAMEEPDMILSKILEHYDQDMLDEFSNDDFIKNRDLVLDALSDGGTVAPLVKMAKLHAKANPRSYMYVFSHPRAMQDYSGQQRQMTVHGEDLPYVLGVPLFKDRYHLRRRYNIGEKLFSEAMMSWWCNFAYTGNPNAPRKMSYLTDSPKEWLQYQVDWPEYNIKKETYFNLTIPPQEGHRYRSSEMQFWNIDLPDLTRHKPRGPRPEFLDRADGIGNYGDISPFRSTEDQVLKYTTDVPNNLDAGYSSKDDANEPSDRFPYSHPEVNLKQDGFESTTDETDTLKGSSAITMVIGFGIVFLVMNITAFFYLYHRRQGLKNKDVPSLKKRKSNSKDEGGGGVSGSRRIKGEKNTENLAELGRMCDSKPDISEVIKNDKAYDNSSNFGRRSKLSRQNSTSTIDTHIKVKEWIQQEIVHRCSPRFLRKTRETLQKEHQEKLTKQQEMEEEEQRIQEEKILQNRMPKTIYDEGPLVIRPGGKKMKAPKVSVAIDATPATRTDSILNQIPIELIKDLDATEGPSPYETDFRDLQMAPQVVVIEHHHSRSDPLPMDSVFNNARSNFPTMRVSESDSGSSNSLYAKINPKLKNRMPRFEQEQIPEGGEISRDTLDGSDYPKPFNESIYGRVPRMTTFGVNQNDDINVTCREPMTERENISPEEALKTIKRRNYPKVLPDIEKRRSLPVSSSSTFIQKPFGNSFKDHRHGPHPSCNISHPPPPPPRLFGTTKSLDLPEEEEEPVTTNLHVGPLLRRQNSMGKNQSDSSFIDSTERVTMNAQEVLSNHRDEYGLTPNPKCPVHGTPFLFPGEESESTNTSRSVDGLDRNVSSPHWFRELKGSSTTTPNGIPNMSLPNVSIGNPNWYKTLRKQKDDSQQFIQYENPGNGSNYQARSEPKIVITPRIINIPSDEISTVCQKNSDQDKIKNLDQISKEKKNSETFDLHSGVMKEEKKEPKILIVPAAAAAAAVGTTRQPMFVIKPTTNVPRNFEQYIPNASAISLSKGVQNFSNNELDTKGAEKPDMKPEKPPIKKKPTVTRIPSFSRRMEEHTRKSSDKTSAVIYPEKMEVVQRVNAVPTTEYTTIPVVPDNKLSIPTLRKETLTTESGSIVCNSSLNTNTIKRKPSNGK